MFGQRIYRPPQFNVLCAVWYGELPADLNGWRARRPNRGPDLVSKCQLYYPRYGVGRWLHSWSASVQDTLLKSGFQELRLPRGTVVRVPWIVTPADDWRLVPLVEVPIFSGRFYAAVMADIAHVGFVNEYAVVLLSQLGDVPFTGWLGLGLGLSASYVPGAALVGLGVGLGLRAAMLPPGLAARLGLGLGLSAATRPPTTAARLGLGLGLAAAVNPASRLASLGLGLGLVDEAGSLWGFARLGLGLGLAAAVNPATRGASLGLGLGLAAALNPSAIGAKLGLGLGLNASASPSAIPAKLGLGLGLNAVVSSGGGHVSPGVTCIAAGLVTLPFSQAGITDPGNDQWFKANVTNGVIYHVRLTQAMMGAVNAAVYKGSCGSLTFLGSLSSGLQCLDFTMSGGGQLFVDLSPNLGGGQPYTLAIDTGVC